MKYETAPYRSKTIIFGRTPSESAAGGADIVACRETLDPLLFSMAVMQRRKESVITFVSQGALLIISRSIQWGVKSVHPCQCQELFLGRFGNQPGCRVHSSVTLVWSGIRQVGLTSVPYLTCTLFAWISCKGWRMEESLASILQILLLLPVSVIPSIPVKTLGIFYNLLRTLFYSLK